MINVIPETPTVEKLLAHYEPDFESDPKYTEDEALFMTIIRAYIETAPTGGYRGRKVDWETLYAEPWGYPRVQRFCKDRNIPCGKAKASRVRDHLMLWQETLFHVPGTDPPEYDYTKDFSAPPPHILYPEEGW